MKFYMLFCVQLIFVQKSQTRILVVPKLFQKILMLFVRLFRTEVQMKVEYVEAEASANFIIKSFKVEFCFCFSF